MTPRASVLLRTNRSTRVRSSRRSRTRLRMRFRATATRMATRDGRRRHGHSSARRDRHPGCDRVRHEPQAITVSDGAEMVCPYCGERGTAASIRGYVGSAASSIGPGSGLPGGGCGAGDGSGLGAGSGSIGPGAGGSGVVSMTPVLPLDHETRNFWDQQRHRRATPCAARLTAGLGRGAASCLS
jgi:hypothetical protein